MKGGPPKIETCSQPSPDPVPTLGEPSPNPLPPPPNACSILSQLSAEPLPILLTSPNALPLCGNPFPASSQLEEQQMRDGFYDKQGARAYLNMTSFTGSCDCLSYSECLFYFRTGHIT